jgi:tRNA (adenine37-N6)-methyltransferase
MIEIKPIGFVHSERREATDDGWDAVSSWIELAEGVPAESLAGLGDFSHIEVLYHFDRVKPESVVLAAEHPRENPAWPLVGIFAQRKKARPNRLGATIARIKKVEGNRIFVESLDAIDGTPVIDIKPVYRQFLPRGEVTQPEWVNEMMRDYW